MKYLRNFKELLPVKLLQANGITYQRIAKVHRNSKGTFYECKLQFPNNEEFSVISFENKKMCVIYQMASDSQQERTRQGKKFLYLFMECLAKGEQTDARRLYFYYHLLSIVEIMLTFLSALSSLFSLFSCLSHNMANSMIFLMVTVMFLAGKFLFSQVRKIAFCGW